MNEELTSEEIYGDTVILYCTSTFQISLWLTRLSLSLSGYAPALAYSYFVRSEVKRTTGNPQPIPAAHIITSASPQHSPDLIFVMSAKHESSTAGKTKQFGKGERHIPHHSQKARKYYPAEDEVKPKQVCIQEDIICHGLKIISSFLSSHTLPLETSLLPHH